MGYVENLHCVSFSVKVLQDIFYQRIKFNEKTNSNPQRETINRAHFKNCKKGRSITMNIKAIQAELSTFADARDWDQFHNPKNLVMALSVEAAELVEIFQWLTPEQAAAIMSSDESEHVKEEIADVLIYCLRLADKLDIALEPAVLDKIAKNGKKHLIKN